jgi:hypothetical protein
MSINAANAIQGTRNANASDLIEILKAQQSLKIDVVAGAARLRFKDANLVLTGMEPVLDEDGVTDANGHYRPTFAADGDLAEKLTIPVKYLRRLRSERPDMYDFNVNSLLRGKYRVNHEGGSDEVYAPDKRSFMLRLFKSAEGNQGVLRAVLSDRYGRVDHLDLIKAVQSGIEQAGVQVQITECDLTDSWMRVKAFSPQVQALAPTLLANYRNPFANPEMEQARRDISRWQQVAEREGQGVEDLAKETVFAGFEFANSETGDGAVRLQPMIRVRVCRNGLTLPAFVAKQAHLGIKLAAGWNREVQSKQLAVITAMAKQKVSEWLSPAFLEQRVAEIEEKAGVSVVRPKQTIEVLAKQFSLTEAESDGILGHFMAGGSPTAGGVANAFTSYSQTVRSVERSDAIEQVAIEAMNVAAAQARLANR